MDAMAGVEEDAEADRFPNIFHSIYTYLLQQFLNHINNII